MLEFLQSQMQAWPWLQNALITPATVLFFVVGALLVLWAVLGLFRRRKRFFRQLRTLFWGTLLVISSSLYMIIAGELDTYTVLHPEREILDITFEALEEGGYQVNLHPLDGGDYLRLGRRQWAIQGDEWRLGMRLLQGHGLLNTRPHFRLQRLLVRKSEKRLDDQPDYRAYRLVHQPIVDIGMLIRRNPAWFPGLQMRQTSSDYLPVTTAVVYRIALNNEGFVVRQHAVNTIPAN